jgi:hypothetical protein
MAVAQLVREPEILVAGDPAEILRRRRFQFLLRGSGLLSD